MTDLWLVPLAVLLWTGLVILAIRAYRRLRVDVPIVLALWRDAVRAWRNGCLL